MKAMAANTYSAATNTYTTAAAATNAPGGLQKWILTNGTWTARLHPQVRPETRPAVLRRQLSNW